MNKKFANFFTSNYGMDIDGKFARGTLFGYETTATVIILDNVSPLRMHVSFYATDEQKRTIENSIRNLALKYFQMRFTRYGLYLGFNDITVKRLLKRLPEALEKICGILEENGATKAGYCPVCGNPIDEVNSKLCAIEYGLKIRIDNDCVDTINAVINAENADYYNAPNNYLKGFAGAFIGGLVGVAISVACYAIGIVTSISAFIAIALGAFLYEKFHGKPNKMMIVIVTITSLAMLVATIPVVYIAAADLAAKANNIEMSAIDAFRICMEDAQFSRYFYADLGLVLLFSALGAGAQIFALRKKIQRQNNI